MSAENELRIFTCNGNIGLAKAICNHLEIPLGKAQANRFSDGEIKVAIDENIRGNDVYIIQSTCPPVNENLMELCIMIDAVKRASCRRVTAVIPYFGYARQDRKHEGRVPITAKLVANMLTVSGADRILTMDLHATQIQGFFDIPVDHLYSAPVFIEFIKERNVEDLVIMCPDIGSSKMAGAFANHLGCDLAIGDKRRKSDIDVTVERIIGDVDGKNVVMIDDMISTAGTITDAAQMARSRGAKSVTMMAIHPVFCGPALERLNQVEVDELIVSDSIPVSESFSGGFKGKLTVLSSRTPLGSSLIKNPPITISK